MQVVLTFEYLSDPTVVQMFQNTTDRMFKVLCNIDRDTNYEAHPTWVEGYKQCLNDFLGQREKDYRKGATN